MEATLLDALVGVRIHIRNLLRLTEIEAISVKLSRKIKLACIMHKFRHENR